MAWALVGHQIAGSSSSSVHHHRSMNPTTTVLQSPECRRNIGSQPEMSRIKCSTASVNQATNESNAVQVSRLQPANESTGSFYLRISNEIHHQTHFSHQQYSPCGETRETLNADLERQTYGALGVDDSQVSIGGILHLIPINHDLFRSVVSNWNL